ncbi:putative B3 domain-containing protein [Dichanthelium oligosanthes]|uniref:Putative B3 domain-containing protein n=1 Tax=Dichanthelium oligosanthes TaxID=888268 RepID=A0A1E5W9E3_9POAL|nr:putative B3 domain-containing protein [Dichanthelium oligosanthes]
MASSPSDAGARTVPKQLKALMPPSFHKLRISDELAGCFVTGDSGGEGSALVVSPLGKVWRVEVGRDGDGAFLGRGWAECLAAHGIGVGWFVVLRHEGGGALTFKAFDTSLCIKEFAAPAAVMVSGSSKGVACKPQFIRIIYPDLTEKMIIPARFVKHYVTEEHLNSRMAVIVSPLGKFWKIELENNQSGMFFAGGWSQFLVFHGISKGDVLLLRYEGNMVFKFKAFGLSGCQKDFTNQKAGIQQNIEIEQESPSPIRKLKSNDEKPSSEENERPKSSLTSLNRKPPRKKPDYQIGPPSWIRKEINTYVLRRLLSLSIEFCRSIGFQSTCTITLKTKMDSTRSWQVHGAAYKNKYCYILGDGWKSFCQENKLKTGDLCTFNIIETTLWHVTIKRSLADTKRQKESPCSPSKQYKTKKGNSGSEERMRPKGSINSFSKASKYTRSVYEIGPPSWIQKEMNTNSIAKQLCLAPTFCSAIGLRKCCTITLKVSTNRSRSWHVRGVMHKNGFYIGLGWIKFCRENMLKVGDICTFNVIKTTLWHVVIIRS